MSNRLSTYWIVIITFLLIGLVCGGLVLAFKQANTNPVEIFLSPTAAPEYIGEIYIGGAVTSPGFYSWEKDDTIENLVQIAGIIPSAELTRVSIYITDADETSTPQRININRAQAWLLQALPGIGETRAQAIVDYRNLQGPFYRIENLLEVEGIGLSTLDQIRDLITVEG